MMKTTMLVIAAIGVGAASVSLADQDEKAGANPHAQRAGDETEFAALADTYLDKFRPLKIKTELAWWEANTTGSDAAYQRKQQADNALLELHSDRETFAKLKSLKADGKIGDPLLRRTLDVMYRAFLPSQADPKLQKRIIELEAGVEQLFNTHRSEVDGKQHSENDVRQIIREAKDSAAARKAWEGYMAVGGKVARQLRELVTLRNQVARELGFRNYFAMKLYIDEVEESELWKVFDELDALTREPYAALKGDIDAAMAARFDIKPADLRPWHYGDLFFQEAPGASDDPFEAVFKGKDMLALAKDYYESLGMEVEDILARSDLYEKPGKCPHAFATDIDRNGDTRILCNLKSNPYWMDTLLHELGHAVYDKYIGKDVAYLIHTASHGITTEGIALMFGAMTKNEEWLIKTLKLPPGQAAELGRSTRQRLQAEKLIFSRWAQVMVRFERGMYENPDQDLGKLWWDLKKRYQLLNPPDDATRPDYAAKIHVVTTPVYYHNYLFGDLFASQVQHYISARIMNIGDPTSTSFYGRKDVGDYLRTKVFESGNACSWNELTRRATGEPLTAKYFADQYVMPQHAQSKG